ncbi:hypothetical protein ACLOJK_001981 [Asimina triloba]
MPNYSAFLRSYLLLKPTPSPLFFMSLRLSPLLPNPRLPFTSSVCRGRTYCIPQRHRPAAIVAAAAAAAASASDVSVSPRSLELNLSDSQGRDVASSNDLFAFFKQPSRRYGRYAYDDYSEDESDVDSSSSSQLIRISTDWDKSSSTVDNIDEWKWKLSMLVRNNNEQEIVSREKKDRRDYEQLAAMAARMGLHCHQYEKVVVFSKVPLPNYRSDLDDKRPQREVSIPASLHRSVDALLTEHLARKPSTKGSFPGITSSRISGSNNYGTEAAPGLHEPQKPVSVVMERILRRKSLQLRDQQEAWQESPEGQKMLEFRRGLPAYKEKDGLLTAIMQHQVVVVSGETGCGKTTQLPQYILESEIEAARGALCSIVCTQPRRISAMAVSERVAAERGEKLGESVGYKVRLEGMKGRDTRLLFCTTGVLLRRLLVDRDLKGVTHVIVDEIHERGMNEDFLLIVLKDLLLHRPELRLVLMSATLNAELFSSYFNGAPMIHIPGFTYPVRTHFLENILEMTGYRLTPHNQIDDYGQEKKWKMQKQAMSRRKSQISSVVGDVLEAADFRQYSFRTRESLSCWNPDSIGFNLIENVLCHICMKERPGAILVFMTGWDDINSLKEQLQAHPVLGDPSRVLLLACHGSMASSEQRLIFDKPPDGVRKIVLATNMAETSITINDVVFVVDCGKAKETSYDALNNTPCLLPSWISKAAARQQYNSKEEEELVEFNLSLCLQIKSLQLGGISEFLSRALQSPELLSVQNAVDYLRIIGAFDEEENLTVLGRHLSMLPVEPKLGKMLLYGAIFNCLDPILTVVAGLSVRDPFLMPFDKKDLAESAKSQFSAQDFSDHLALVRAYEGWKEAEKEQSGYDYCWRNFLSFQTLKAIDSLRKQFFFLLKDTGLVDGNCSTCNSWSYDEPLIRAIICAGLYPGVSSVVVGSTSWCLKLEPFILEKSAVLGLKFYWNLEALTSKSKANKQKSIALKTMEDGQVLLYSNSVNSREQRIPYPWLVFNEKVKVNSVFLRDSTAVSDSVMLLFGGDISRGGLDGHLKMLDGYLEFFMKPGLAETYLNLKRELNELIHQKGSRRCVSVNGKNRIKGKNQKRGNRIKGKRGNSIKGKGGNCINGEEQWNTGSTRVETKRKMKWNIGETVTTRRSVTVGREEDGKTWLLWTVACGTEK